MPLITFTSDFGLRDHYVAFTKARILKYNPTAQIFDISHDLKCLNDGFTPFNPVVMRMANIIDFVFREFPQGTIHLVGRNATKTEEEYIIGCVEGHTFVCTDNGLLSLISNDEPIRTYTIPHNGLSGFELLPQIAAKLAAGETPEQLGTPKTDMVRSIRKKAKITKNEIRGAVIHTDHYGNLITNIEKADFDALSTGRPFKVILGRDSFHKINAHIYEEDEGEVFIIFNANQKLMIGINEGNGAQLLGLKYNDNITIEF